MRTNTLTWLWSSLEFLLISLTYFSFMIIGAQSDLFYCENEFNTFSQEWSVYTSQKYTLAFLYYFLNFSCFYTSTS